MVWGCGCWVPCNGMIIMQVVDQGGPCFIGSRQTFDPWKYWIIALF